MGWLLIVMQIISAIPSIIRIVKEIIDLIHSLPKAKQGDAGAELKAILAEKAPNKRLQRLQDFKDRMRMQAKKP
jgi:hypothetical protein